MASEEDSDRSESGQDRGASDVELTVASSPLQLEVKLSHEGSDVVDAQSVAVPPGTNQQRLQQMVCDQFGLTCSLSDVRLEHLPDGGVPALRDGQSIVAIVGGDAHGSSAPTQDNQRTISVFLENTATGDLQTGEVSVSATAEFPEVRAAVLSAFSLTAGTCDLILQDFPTAGVAALAPGTPVFAVCTPRRKEAQPSTPTAAPSQPTQAAPSPRGDGTSGDGVDSGSVAPSLTAPVPPDVGADTTSGDGTPPHRRPSRRGNRNRPSSDAVPVAANATPTHVVATTDLVNWLHEECPYKCGYSHAEPAERDLVADVGARKKLRRVLLLHVQGPGDVAHQVFEICERARVCQLRQRLAQLYPVPPQFQRVGKITAAEEDVLAGLGNASQFIQSDPGPAIVFGSFLKLLDMRVAATPRRPLHVPPPVPDGVRATLQGAEPVTLSAHDFVDRTFGFSYVKRPHVSGVEFSPQGLDTFFGVSLENTRRLGWLYGRVLDDGWVQVLSVYEPPQAVVGGRLLLSRDPLRQRVDETASWLGLSVVGWMFTEHPSARAPGDTQGQFTSSELLAMTQQQIQNPNFITVLVSQHKEEGSHQVEFVTRAYQAAPMCLDMYQTTPCWFDTSEYHPQWLTTVADVIGFRANERTDMRTRTVHTFLLRAHCPTRPCSAVLPHDFPVLPQGHGPIPNHYFGILKDKLRNRDVPMLSVLRDWNLLLLLSTHRMTFRLTSGEVRDIVTFVANESSAECELFRPKLFFLFSNRFHCPFCKGLGGRTVEVLLHHVLVCHQTSTKAGVCPMCAASAIDKPGRSKVRTNLSAHILRHTSVIDPDAGAVPMAEKQARRPQRAEAGRARRSSTADRPLRPLEAAVQHVPLCLGPSAMSAAKDAPTNGEGARPKITAAEVDKWLFGGDVMLLRARSEPLFATRASWRHSTRDSSDSGLSVAPARVGTMAGLAGVAPGDAADERAPLDSSDDEF